MGHTPGPWAVADDSSPVNLNVVAKVGKWYVHTRQPFGDAEADANLMAAAPDLLEACKMAVDTIERLGGERHCGRMGFTLDMLDAALAKAEGREP